MAEMKMCSKCHKVLPITDFYKNVSKPDGHSSYCKECTKTANYSYKQKKAVSKASDTCENNKPIKETNKLKDVSIKEMVDEIKLRGKKILVDPLPRDLISELCSLGYSGELKYVEVHTIDVASFNKRQNV